VRVPRIADFGLARVLDPGATISLETGTPAYVAPEAFDGQGSVQTDLWAAGVILYQMLGGSMPFPSGDLTRLLKAIALDPPAPLSETVPSALRQTVFGALDKAPQSRFRSAADMRAALRDTMRQLETRTTFTSIAPSRGARTIAVTGSMSTDPRRTAHRVQTLLSPYCGDQTTWYCGTFGTVDECAASFLLGEGQRVIAVGYGERDVTLAMSALLAQHGALFVDAKKEQVPRVQNTPSQRDVFFSTKADLIVLLWDGVSPGTAKLLSWLRQQGKDHVIGFV
jgi:hypothetical protein